MNDKGDVRETGEMRDARQTQDDIRREEERRSADRRQMTREQLRDNPEVKERESMRKNPEVMGRKEPVAVPVPEHPMSGPYIEQPGRVGGPGEQRAVDAGHSDMWPDMSDFHRRFDQLQSDFIEEPREAVKKAEKLMEEMLDHATKSMRERMQSMHREIDGKADTEQLRLTMQRFREFIRSFGRRETT